MHTCTCMRQGNNVFSDCREKLERPSEAGTHGVDGMVALVIISWAEQGWIMDDHPRSPRTLVPGADRLESEFKASHGKLARARVVVQDGCSPS